MSAKVKLISIISAFVLVLGIMIIGVLSAEQVQVNIGGSVSFNATNVYAKVSGNISGAETGNKTFSTLTYSASETTGDESDWTNLALEFTETPDPIVIIITVENLSTQRTLTVNLENTLQGEGLDIAVTSESGSYTSGTNVELPVSTGDGSSTTTFTLTLTVANPDQSLTGVNFGYILNMYDESSVPVVTYQSFGFQVIEGTENEVRIIRHIGSGNVVIPATFSFDTTTPLTSFIMQDISNLSISQYLSLYLGEFYYTEEGGEKTKTNMLEFESLVETLTFPITLEPTFRYEFDGYSEANAMLLVYAIMMPSAMGYPENINYYLTNDEFIRQAFTTEEIMSYIMENYPEALSDPTTLEPLFSATGSTILEIDPIGSGAIIEGNDYIVTEIGDSAFRDHTSLTSITIPESVTSIGTDAFGYCYALAEVYNYSPSITVKLGETSSSNNGYLGQYAKVVYNASDLSGDKPATRITVVDNMQYYNYGDDFIVLAPVVAIETLTEVTLDNRTTEINQQAFRNCDSLTSITIPSSVTSIGDRAFYHCSSLTSITITDSVTSIGNGAFSYCRSLTSITLPSSITSISDSAFWNCGSLTSITIPASVTTIGSSAFYQCHALAEVYNYSPSITVKLGETSSSNNGYLGQYAKVVYNASDLTGVKPETRITVVDNVQYYNYGDDFIVLAPTSRRVTEVALDSRTTEINQYAFYNCDSLTTVNFGDSSQLTSISFGAFYSCDSLSLITIPNSVTSIGSMAFFMCNSLTSITIPESVTSIGNQAFEDCISLNDVTIESDDIYLDLTSLSACGYLIFEVNATGDTVKVLKSVVDSVDPDFTVNTYLNGSNFTRTISEDGLYYIYTHN